MNKFVMFFGCRFLEQAANIAFQQRDIQNLTYVQSKCGGDAKLLEKISNMIMQLESRK